MSGGSSSRENDLSRCLVIGTRASKLALVQTRIVSEALCRACPDVSVEIRRVVTAGDRRTSGRTSEEDAQGAFTRDIERKLLEGEIDLAVHSLKDMPVELPKGLVLAATPERGDPRDAIVCREAGSLDELPEGAVMGTSSPRRAAQILHLRPDLTVRELHGNVDTRLAKLSRGEYDAVIVAKAALDRLGQSRVITEVLSPEVFLPAAGQGALAVETRDGDLAVSGCVGRLNDAGACVATTAERRLLARLGGGCGLCVGVLAETEGNDGLRLRASVTSPDGKRSARVESHGTLENPGSVVDDCLEELSRLGLTENGKL
jgi:hydroxymethylbilane synthase